MWLGREECLVTWEAAETVPQSIVEEYEIGLKPSVADCTTKSSGIFHKLKVVHESASGCGKRPVVKENEGLAAKLMITIANVKQNQEIRT